MGRVAYTPPPGLHSTEADSRTRASNFERKGATMTKIAEVMTQRPRAVTAQMGVREAARLMDEEDVGSLPVVDEAERLIGVVTDRDVAVRVVGRGLDAESTLVGD